MKSNNDKKWTIADVLTNFGKNQAQVQQEKQLKQQLKEALMQNQTQALGQFVPGMNQPMQQDISLEQSYEQAKYGGINIDPSKKGTFKAQATRMGMGIQEAAAHILANRDEYTSGMVRKANFARNFAKEEGGETNEPCPPGTHWDSVLRDCVSDEKKPGVSPTREELFNDPEYRKNIDRLEYKKDVGDYLNYGEQKKDDYIKENYKGPRKQYDDGTLGPDVSPEWDQFQNSKEFQNLLKKFPWSIDGMLLEKDPGWQLPNDGPVNIEHYPLVGPWNKEDTDSYNRFFNPATNDYPENYDEDGNFLYKPQKVLQNSKELKEQLNNRYEDWCPCSKKQELMVNGRPIVKEVCVPCEQAEYGGQTYAKGGEMIKRADGSYSQRGLWDNIRANKGSGKKPTASMLEQERKIRKKAIGGIIGPNNCQEGFEWNDIYQTCVPVSRNFF